MNTLSYTQDTPKAAAEAYSKEQIIKQNILTLFRWIEGGNLKEAELKNAVSFIKKQPAVYGYMDNSFFAAFIKGYEFEANNAALLNRLFVAATGKTITTLPRHPWLDIQNNLIDCLENEVIISCSGPAKYAKTDLTKPEIYVAPDINSIVDLVTRTVTPAIEAQLGLSAAYKLVHKGSTARGVSLDNTEFDFDPLFGNQKDYDLFLKRLPSVLSSLSERWRLNGVNILSEDSDSQYPWGRLINLIAQDKEGIVFRVQLLVGKDRRSWNEFIGDQMEQIRALGGRWEYVSGQIILFKRLVRDVLHSYGKSYGLDGMMCVEFIVQADSSTEYGRKITSIGSFDKTMRWIYKIGFDQASSAITPFDMATKQTGIYSPDAKKLQITCSPVFWNKLVNAARKYVALGKAEMSEDEFSGLGHTLE